MNLGLLFSVAAAVVWLAGSVATAQSTIVGPWGPAPQTSDEVKHLLLAALDASLLEDL